MSKKVLFISYDGMTDPLGQSQVIPYLKGLATFGYQFVLLSCDKPEKFAAQQQYVLDSLAGHAIEWVSIPYHKTPPVLSSIYDYRQLKKKAAALHRKHGFALVHTRPGIPQLVALQLVKKYGIKFLNDIRGFWADERVDGNMWNLKNPFYKSIYTFFKRKEEQCIELADHNTCLTYKGKEEILSWKQVAQPVKLSVVPCSVDLQLFDPAAITATQKAALRKELGIAPTDLVISYLGSIGGWYLTNEMMLFCKLLLETVPTAKFLFISNNSHADIIDAAAKFGVPPANIIIRMGKRHEVPALLSLSNYSLFFIKPCYSKISSSPTKHGEIMAMGIPVITNSGVGDVKEIVEKYNGGYVIDELTAAGMQPVVDKIVSQKDHFDAMAIRNGAEEFYSLDKTVSVYAGVYDGITQ